MAKIETPATSLLNALKFIEPLQKKTGHINDQFCLFKDGLVRASNGVITLGYPVVENFTAEVHTKQLIAALSKIKTEFSLSILDNGALCLNSGHFRALVPTIENGSLNINEDDFARYPIGEAFKSSISEVFQLANENAKVPQYAAIQISTNSCFATNGAAILEAWHGLNMPSVQIPAIVGKLIAKTKLNLTHFYYRSDNPFIIFYFENGAFIKTALYNLEQLDYLKLLNKPDNLHYVMVPESFYQGVAAVEAFSSDGFAFLENGALVSKPLSEIASSFKIDADLPNRVGIGINILKSIKAAFKLCAFDVPLNKVYFTNGDKVRGVFALAKVQAYLTQNKISPQNPVDCKDDEPFPMEFDDDIPF